MKKYTLEDVDNLIYVGGKRVIGGKEADRLRNNADVRVVYPADNKDEILSLLNNGYKLKAYLTPTRIRVSYRTLILGKLYGIRKD